MTQTDWNLIILALAAVALLVVLVTRLKINAFIALIAAALVVGLGAVAMNVTEIQLDKSLSPPAWKTLTSLTSLRLITAFQEGLGATLGSTAAIIALGTMLGKLLAESGGAEVLAKRFAAFFGPDRVGLCIMSLALVVGLVTWFAVGLVLLHPSHSYQRDQKAVSASRDSADLLPLRHARSYAATPRPCRGDWESEGEHRDGVVVGIFDRHPYGRYCGPHLRTSGRPARRCGAASYAGEIGKPCAGNADAGIWNHAFFDLGASHSNAHQHCGGVGPR
jgi:hypothetical protein